MKLVKSVAIVGAGSAGWLTALVLNTYCPFLEISLVRPRKLPVIGVGESTQADLLRVLQASRIDVQALFKACDATIKCGIYYEDWNAVGEHYWHPFSNLIATGSYTAAHHYQQMILTDPEHYAHDRYYASVHTSYETCVRKRHVAPESAVAFHLDANKITLFLEQALRTVQVLDSDEVDVRTSDGRISSVSLDGKELKADLYVDCTGFARALLNRVASPDILPYEANVNRVVVAQIPYVDEKRAEITPYTRAHAHENGWTWSIPLQSRIGSGYVYHGDFCSADQAEANFRAYWGVERLRNVPVRHISFDSITLRNPWVENVVAIGLSAGFVEPVEATGLSWIIASADLLAQTLRTRYYDADTSLKYNYNMLGYVYDVFDFIDVHYKLSARRDSEFWKYQTSREFPARLDHRLALYAAEMPNDLNRVKSLPWAFNEVSWLDILNGYRFNYAKLDIHPLQSARAQENLREVEKAPRQSIDPRNCLPVFDSARRPQLVHA
jgi:hypothetical protein